MRIKSFDITPTSTVKFRYCRVQLYRTPLNHSGNHGMHQLLFIPRTHYNEKKTRRATARGHHQRFFAPATLHIRIRQRSASCSKQLLAKLQRQESICQSLARQTTASFLTRKKKKTDDFITCEEIHGFL